MGCLCPKQDLEADNEPSSSLINTTASKEICHTSFKAIKVLGRGTFGKVVLVRKIDTGELYAMKVLKKKLLQELGQQEHTLTEKNILQHSNSPFIAKLFYAFQSPTKLFLVMEFLSGGELFFHLAQNRIFSEVRAKFYTAEILLGLEYLHENGIIYRDLKPENVLLDKEGHIRLTDFGLSKTGISDQKKAHTFCGTPEYLAPEIIMNMAYDKAVDFWSLGALIYYMLSGLPPHYSKNKNEIFKNVITRDVEPLLNVSDAANQLLISLLKINPKHRISSVSEIKNCEWFEGYDWVEIYNKKLVPPFKPKDQPTLQPQNLNKVFNEHTLDESSESVDPTIGPGDYSGFTYKAQSGNSTDKPNFAN